MTGLHTGHAWIRGNGEIPLREEDATVGMALRDAGYRTAVVGKWGLGLPGTAGMPDKKGFDYAFGFLDHRHAHRQFTDHLYRNGEMVATDLEHDYVNDLFTREALAFIGNPDTRPFFLYLNYTVAHAELRVPEDSLAAMRGKFPETAVRERRGRRQADRPRQHLARLSIAADAQGGLRRDDRPDGSRHRHAARPGAHARARRADARHVRERQRAVAGRRRRSGVLQELGRAARHQARPLRGRHPRALHRQLAGHDPEGTRERAPLGPLGHVSDARGTGRREDARRASTACR